MIATKKEEAEQRRNAARQEYSAASEALLRANPFTPAFDAARKRAEKAMSALRKEFRADADRISNEISLPILQRIKSNRSDA